MKIYWIYPIYTSILAVSLILLVPRENIKNNVVYGIILGGVFDMFAIITLTYLLDIGGYINFMPLGFMGFPFFPPIAWTIWFILYFYFLPDNKLLRYLYIVIAAFYSLFFSNILVNIKIMYWNYGRVIVPLLIYITWYSTVTWIKLKLDKEHIK